MALSDEEVQLRLREATRKLRENAEAARQRRGQSKPAAGAPPPAPWQDRADQENDDARGDSSIDE